MGAVMTMGFVTIGDSKFYQTIGVSIQQVRKFYPESPVYVYDWGFTDEQRAAFKKAPSIQLIDWKDRFVDSAPYLANIPQRRSRAILRAIKVLYFGLQPIRREQLAQWRQRVEQRDQFEHLIFQKPFCFLDCLRRHCGPLVFLDGDAFLYNSIDEVFDGSFDIGVTVRRLEELDFRLNRCAVINSGVIFFSNQENKSIAFVQSWIDRMKQRPERIAEQTALTRLIQEENTDIFTNYYQLGSVRTNSGSVKVKTFPCDVYNFNWIEEGVDSTKNKILHFKGVRHLEENLGRLLSGLNISDVDISKSRQL